MKKKSYKITFSLQEGYAPRAQVHKIGVAERIIKSWLTERLQQQQPIVSGLLQQGTLFFPAKGGGKDPVTASPTAVYYGELSEPADMKRTNKELKATLESLALALKNQLNQQSVFIVYRDKNWCV